MILKVTAYGYPLKLNGIWMYPLNVASDGVCCTLNTRYENLIAPNHIMNLAHYPRTVVLYEYDFS